MSERRGTINFEADGKSYALRLGTNQLADAEEAFNKPIGAIMKAMQGDGVKVSDLRRLFGIAAGLTEAEAGDLMDEIGLDHAGDLLGQAAVAAFPPAEGGSGNGRSRKRT